MTSPRTTRRLAIAAIALIWILVCGGLGWATRSAIQLDRFENREGTERSYEDSLALAVSRLDAIVDTVVAREKNRPYEHFRAWYKPANLVSAVDFHEIRDPQLLEPSPIQNLPGPDWLLLHFQVSEAADATQWQSPQLRTTLQFAVPAGGIPAADRARLATADNWLAALRERYPPLVLLEMLEATRTEGIVTRNKPEPDSAKADGEATDDALPQRRTEIEFSRRVAELQERYPPESCEPALVAFENLVLQSQVANHAAEPASCVSVTLMPMIPLWLELTMDGPPVLALVRTVAVEGSLHCALQGVLFDWEQLRTILENKAREYFPADQYPSLHIYPAQNDSPSRGAVSAARLPSLPIELDTGPPAHAAAANLSTSLKLGLSVAWLAPLLALIAITYGTIRYFAMAERRMRFVAAVTHELRTPLTTFQLYTDLLADARADDPLRRRNYVETLRGESKRLGRLVENVLTYSRMGGQKPKLELTEARPVELLQLAAAETAERCASANKNVVLEAQADDSVRIVTDKAIVVQILSNLIENSCKYSADASDQRIWLRTHLNGAGSICFEVEDAGQGIRVDERRAVFQPFRRGREHSTTAAGMGLGLALSRHWAECLGGELAVRRSDRNGSHYSCFALTLPLQTVQQR